VAHEVTNVGHDRDQLSNMAQLARDATGVRQLIALADRGYFEGYEILKCEQAGIATLVPKPMTPTARRRVASTSATSSTTSMARHCTSTGPQRAPPADQEPVHTECLSPHYPLEHEAVLDMVQARLDGVPEAPRLRRQTVEHVFGTLKASMGSTHFLTKTLPRVRTAMGLQVLAYNLKRAIKILGAQNLMLAMQR
jgi:hypothetical protein